MVGRPKCWCKSPKTILLPFCNACTDTVKLLQETGAVAATDTLQEYLKQQKK